MRQHGLHAASSCRHPGKPAGILGGMHHELHGLARPHKTRRSPRLTAQERGSSVCLSFAQERLWFLERMGAADTTYNMPPTALRLLGKLHVESLQRSFAELIHRHEILRTRFAIRDGAPVQVIEAHPGFTLEVEDMTDLPAAGARDPLQRRVQAEALKTFDLVSGPAFRVRLIRLDEREHVLLLTMHHIIADGWSMGVLGRELSTLYASYVQGRESPLPQLPVQYADYALWQRQWLQGESLQEQLSYWKARLAGAPPVLELPTDRPRPAVASFKGATRSFALSEELSAGIRELARREGVTLYMLILAAFQVLLGRWSGQTDIVVGSPIAGRTRPQLEPLIGLFINTLLLRTDLSADPPFRELLRQVKATALGAYAHQELPFERLVAELKPERDLSRQLLFQVILSMGADAATSQLLKLPELEVQRLGGQWMTSKVDLTLFIFESPRELRGAIEYATDLFERSTIERMVGHFRVLLEGIVSNPDCRVEVLPLLTPAERHQLLFQWNATRIPYPQDKCIHELFSDQARRTPDAVAVVCGDQQLRYGELEKRSNQLGNYLRSVGSGPEVVVGLCVENSLDMVVCLYGILKSGGAYLPLDPNYPGERLAHMLADARVRLLVTQERLLPCLPVDARASRLCIDSAWHEISGQSDSIPESRAGVANLAYVIYTSGSTGTSKGAANIHAGVVNLLRWYFSGPLGACAAERVILASSISFDLTQKNILGALASGATLVIPAGPAFDRAAFRDAVAKWSPTRLNCAPSAFRALLEGSTPEGLRMVVLGGEPIDSDIIELLARSQVLLVNSYGPTECADVATFHVAPCVAGSRPLPIGSSVGNVMIRILDRHLNPVPIGVIGEIGIAGVGVGRGYLNRPELTADRFMADVYGEPGSRMYRTGDLGRYLPDGTIEFLGRSDFQVKIRGFRIELGEVEEVLRKHQGIGQAVVVAREGAPHGDVPGERCLVAYIVPNKEESELSSRRLRAYLKTVLPDYMIPSAFMLLEQLPLTPSGKIDRRSLPAPDRLRESSGFVPGRTPTEQALTEIWAEVLTLPRVGIYDDFFSLGGHSLLVMRTISRIRDILHVNLGVRELFERPTIADLALLLEQSSSAVRVNDSAAPLAPRETGNVPPLSYAQERLWFLEQLGDLGPAYSIRSILRLSGTLDIAALTRSLEEIQRRHEILRTRIGTAESEGLQVIESAGSCPLQCLDFSTPGEAEREVRMLEFLDQDLSRGFDLTAGPLWRAFLIRLDEREYVLLLNMHHIISDGWSMGVLGRELSTLYTSYVQGRESPLPQLPVQYADYALWQRHWLQGELLQEQLSYWKAHLAGAPPVLKLPTDRPRPAVATFKGKTCSFELPEELSAEIRELARREGVTLYMLILAAFQVLLSRWSGQMDIVVGSPIAGRTRLELESLIGLFVNTLLLRTDLAADPPFRELLRQVKATALGAYAHQELPFERLVAELKPERDLSHQLLFQVILSMEADAAMSQLLKLPGLEVQRLGGQWLTSKVDLTLFIFESPRELRGTIEYATDLFEPSTIERLAGHFRVLLEGIVSNPGCPVGVLPLLTPAERHQLLFQWNAAPVSDLQDRCIHELFSDQAQRTPDAIAVVCEGSCLTYQALDARANQLAHHLRSLGAGPDTLVAICMERSLEMITGLLGILKAGGAYVPIDPSYPRERLSYLLLDSGASVLLVNRAVAELRSDTVRTVCMTRDKAAIDGQPVTAPPGPVALCNLIYCIYTSGSSGKPKGTLLTHQNVARLFASTAGQFHFGPQDVWTLFHSFAFDFSVWEIFGAVLHGGRLVVVPYVVSRSPEAYYDLLQREGVTVLNQTPSAFQLLSDVAQSRARHERLTRLRYVIFGGEALSTASLAPWMSLYGCVTPELINMYGITETTVHVTYRRVGEGDIRSSAASPIGFPIRDLQLYVLDRHMNPVPVGIAGELYVGGPGLARGYLNRPELTAERFVPHPDPGFPAERLYRTGDLVRRRVNGELEYLGRIDQQVKLRGFRIELGEIEKAACSHHDVGSAVVEVLGESEEQRLVCWVAADPGRSLEGHDIRRFLAEQLPSFMVPSEVVVLERMPLTGNGKTDRVALAREYIPAPLSRRIHHPPRTALEHALASIWQKVLQTSSIGIDENFFALGGDSIRAIQLVRAARDRGIPLSVALLFKQQNISELAAALAKNVVSLPSLTVHFPDWGIDADTLARVRALDAQDVYPVTAMQALMLREHALSGDCGLGVYHVQQSFRIEGHQPSVEAMREALRQLIEEHPVLRTAFLKDCGDTFVQVIQHGVEVTITEHDLVSLDALQQREYFDHVASSDRASPFEVESGGVAPYRFHWFRTGASSCHFFMSIHHAIDDGWGNQHFLVELFDRYWKIRLGERPVVKPRANVFKELVALEREMAASPEAAEFWRSLRIAPTGRDQLKSRRAVPGERVQHAVRADSKLLGTLQAGCQSAGVSLRAAVLASYARVIRRLLGAATATIGVVCNGRSERLSDPLHALGLFWNLLPVCIPEDSPSSEQSVQRFLTAIEPYSAFPLTSIACQYGTDELFFATLNFTNFHNRLRQEVGTQMRVAPLRAHDRFHYPLNFHVAVLGEPDTLVVNVEFDNHYFSAATVCDLAAEFLTVLTENANILAQPVP